jgi:hypothetical protein
MRPRNTGRAALRSIPTGNPDIGKPTGNPEATP